MTTPILGITEVAQSQSNKEAAINNAIRALENATQRRFAQVVTVDFTLSATDYTRNFYFDLSGTPGAPTTMTVPDSEHAFYVFNGTDDQIIVGSAQTGETVTIELGEGRLLYNNGLGDILQIGGGAGGGGATDFSIATFFQGDGVDENAELVYVCVKTGELPANFVGSETYAETPSATGTVDIDVQYNNVSFGTISFAVSSNTATFTSTLQAFTPGDRIKFVMPAALDSLAGIAINLLASITP